VVFLEGQARLLLVLHAVLGAATVAVTTHLFLWSRRWARSGARRPGVRWFAVAALGLYASQFALGNLLYPTYKVRVRAEYLDSPATVASEASVRSAARAELHVRAGAPPPPEPDGPRVLSPVARLFDVKEHWVAVGLPLAIVATLLVFGWDPKRDGAGARGLLLATTGGAAACAWFAALVGLWVSAVRAVG